MDCTEYDDILHNLDITSGELHQITMKKHELGYDTQEDNFCFIHINNKIHLIGKAHGSPVCHIQYSDGHQSIEKRIIFDPNKSDKVPLSGNANAVPIPSKNIIVFIGGCRAGRYFDGIWVIRDRI